MGCEVLFKKLDGCFAGSLLVCNDSRVEFEVRSEYWCKILLVEERERKIIAPKIMVVSETLDQSPLLKKLPTAGENSLVFLWCQFNHR